MKKRLYTQTKDDCWRIALCNFLKISPKKVPHFVKRYDEQFVEETKKWLNKRGKSIIYLPFSSFLESGNLYVSNSLCPQGRCIAILEKETDLDNNHACFMENGKLLETPGRNYDKLIGFFIIYNL